MPIDTKTVRVLSFLWTLLAVVDRVLPAPIEGTGSDDIAAGDSSERNLPWLEAGNFNIQSQIEVQTPSVRNVDETRAPYVVSISEVGMIAHVCTGVLVHEQWVLTVAHCVDPNSTFSAGFKPHILIGVADMRHPITKLTKRLKAIDTIIHPQWNGREQSPFNLALLKLEAKTNVTVPEILIDQTKITTGQPVSAVGWGNAFINVGDYIFTRLKIETEQFIDGKSCNRSTLWNHTLSEGLICTITNRLQRSSCVVDSGAPLLIFDPHGAPNYDYLIAVNIGGGVCGKPEKPDVFINLRQHVCWMYKFISGFANASVCGREFEKMVHHNKTSHEQPSPKPSISFSGVSNAKGSPTKHIAIGLSYGLVLVVVVVLAAVLYCGWCCWYSQRQIVKELPLHLKLSDEDQQQSKQFAPQQLLKDWKLNWNLDVKRPVNPCDSKVIGKGSFGRVERSFLPINGSDGKYYEIPVALKIVYPGKTPKATKVTTAAVEALKNEAAILEKIGWKKNVVRCYGGKSKNGVLEYIVSELMDQSLSDYIHKENRSPRNSTIREGGSRVGTGIDTESIKWRNLLKIFADVGHGLSSLHSEHIVHQDLSTNNILLLFGCEGVVAKINDFGISKIKQSYHLDKANGGTYGYMAPEIKKLFFKPIFALYNEAESEVKISEKCDIYSFGVIMWECIERRKPPEFEDLIVKEETMTTQSEIQPSQGVFAFETKFPDHLSSLPELIRKCLNKNAEGRPTASDVFWEIENLRELHKNRMIKSMYVLNV